MARAKSLVGVVSQRLFRSFVVVCGDPLGDAFKPDVV